MIILDPVNVFNYDFILNTVDVDDFNSIKNKCILLKWMIINCLS